MIQRKQIFIVSFCAILFGSLYWYHLVTSYESELGTDNTFVVNDADPSVSGATNDSLLSLEFNQGQEELEWAFTTITVYQGNNEFDCTLGGVTSVPKQGGKVNTRLNADGQTFTISVDATSESSFTKFSLNSMGEDIGENYSMRFSKTDIFFGENLSWFMVKDTDFSSLTSLPEGNFSDDNSERLDWYEYDISTHRVEASDQIYIVDDGSTIYKIQLISYYNQDDESRHVTFIVARLGGEEIAAIFDENLVQSSPCIIIDDNQIWSPYESIYIKENAFQICEDICDLEIIVTYESVKVKGTKNVQIQ